MTSAASGTSRVGRATARALLGAVVLALVAGCTLPTPREAPGGKRAVSDADASAVVSQLSRVHDDAVSGRTPLGTVQTGEVAEIDRISHVIRRRLQLPPDTLALSSPLDVWAGRFSRYPLWFATVARMRVSGEQFVGVFERTSSTSPWLLVAAPRLAAGTRIPSVAETTDGSAVVYDALGEPEHWSDGAPIEPLEPDEVVSRYLSVLAVDRSPYREDFVDDSFRQQMRRVSQAQPGPGIGFRQAWSAAPVRYGVRLADGGALLFATLERAERFRVRGDARLSFTGLEAGAYLRAPIARFATVRYRHQVLLLVPASGKPLVVGQYGGVVSATGR